MEFRLKGHLGHEMDQLLLMTTGGCKQVNGGPDVYAWVWMRWMKSASWNCCIENGKKVTELWVHICALKANAFIFMAQHGALQPVNSAPHVDGQLLIMMSLFLFVIFETLFIKRHEAGYILNFVQWEQSVLG